MSALGDDLVPLRDCDGCTVCCRELTIDIPELKKPPGIPCEHCTVDRGCRIYPKRPVLCGVWHCGWRRLPGLDDAWRPDRSGVLITFASEVDIPPAFSLRPAIRIQFVRPLSTLMWDTVVAWIMRLIPDEVPVFLTVSGRPGLTSGRVFLNDGMRTAANAGNREEISALLEKALLASLRYVGEPVVFEAS